MSVRGVTSTLAHAELFADLPAEALRVFEAIQIKSSYPQGAMLFTEGRPPTGVFLLEMGKAKLSISGTESKKLGLRVASPGEILGLSATLTRKPYEATAETLTPSRVGFIWRENFLLFLRGYPEAAFWIVRLLSYEVDSAFAQLRSFRLARPPELEELTGRRFTREYSHEGLFVCESHAAYRPASNPQAESQRER